MKLFYTVSAGDEKASAGMRQVDSMLTKKGARLGRTEFSARLPHEEQEKKAEALISGGYKINFFSLQQERCRRKACLQPA